MTTPSSYCYWLSLKLILILSLHLPATLLRCDARRSNLEATRGPKTSFNTHLKELKLLRHYDEMWSLDSSSNSEPYGIGSPFSLPPFDSLPPVSMPQGQTTPPYCINPPFTSTTNPSPPAPPVFYVPPTFPISSPPPSGSSYPTPSRPPSNPNPIPPQTVPSPPPSYVPTPTGNPPSFEPSPPGGSSGGTPAGSSGGTPGGGGGFAPNPPVFVPSPPVYQPPVIYPPPAVPPPPHHGDSLTLWCVAKPSVPDPIILEAMNYACGSGADCDSIQPNANCYQPNTVLAHASYAFNSYWQMTKVAGGTCEFGGTAILVTVDPSHGGCHYIIT
ncbi:unnamed protein product [Rhodiola kirilowii]